MGIEVRLNCSIIHAAKMTVVFGISLHDSMHGWVTSAKKHLHKLKHMLKLCMSVKDNMTT